MKFSEIEMWQINIENIATVVCSMYGQEVVNSVFQRYGAHSFRDLSSSNYSEVFADLEQITSD